MAGLTAIEHFGKLMKASKSKALAQAMAKEPEKTKLIRVVTDDYALDPRMPIGAQTNEELPGRYWAFTPQEAAALRAGDVGLLDKGRFKNELRDNVNRLLYAKERGRPHDKKYMQKVVKGQPVEGSKTMVIRDTEHFDELAADARRQGFVPEPEKIGQGLASYLARKGYDFVAMPDFEGNMTDLMQVIQLKPQRVRAKLGKKEALLGLTGALGGGSAGMGILDLLQPSEAEAMPRGVYQAASKAVLSKEVSSAAKVLVGKVLDGKTIKDVRKGQGNWRAILFDDETMMTVTNTELNDLSRAFGSQRYTKEFLQKEGPSRTEQAIKSLDYHYARVRPLSTQTLIEQHHHMHRERLKEMGGEAPDFSLVLYKGKYFTMPKVYAEHLQDLGMLQIKKDAK